MKLLILTQKVDVDDDVLGFFHGWIKQFAEKFEAITVVCLGKGKYDLPSNVRVISLGKEIGSSNITYSINFFNAVWRERKNYTHVFVHMNKEYVALGFIPWKVLGKKIIFWYNHAKATFSARLAGSVADSILYTSPQSYFGMKGMGTQMPVGIDTSLFENTQKNIDPHSILYLGRISLVKDTLTLVEALNILYKDTKQFLVSLVGDALPQDGKYFEGVRRAAEPLVKDGRVHFFKAIANKETPAFYNDNAVFVNLTPSGSFDKTIFEAMACERVVLSCNQGFSDLIDAEYRNLCIFKEHDADDLAQKIKNLLNLSPEIRRKMGASFREIVVREHSLQKLSDELVYILENIP